MKEPAKRPFKVKNLPPKNKKLKRIVKLNKININHQKTSSTRYPSWFQNVLMDNSYAFKRTTFTP